MTDTNLTRRDILKTTASATVVGGIATTTGAAASGQTAQVVEAGLRYEIPENQNLDTSVQNSRPPYTVDEENAQLLVSPSAGISRDLIDRVGNAGALVAERPTEPGDSRGLSGSETVSSLPIGLTTRMRSRGSVALTTEHTLPTVKLNWKGRRGKLISKQGPTQLIEPGESTTIQLDTETVSAQTVKLSDELVDDDDIPDYRKAKKTLYGTEEIEVTPVVEVTHRGELDLVSRDIA